MRRARPLILLSIFVLVVTVGVTWRLQQTEARRAAPRTPGRLPERVTLQAGKWSWRHAVGNFTRVEVLADDFRQISEPSRYELRGVELRIFDEKKPKLYDRITSARADFDMAEGVLFSEGEVTIAADVGADGVATGRAMQIKSTGVRFESKTGKVTTDRPTFFTFDRGEGQSTGADYDSKARELRMHKDVVLKWRGDKPGDTPMEITAGNLFYKEADSRIFLTPWAKLRRETLTLESDAAVVTLAEGAIQLVEASRGRGTDVQPERKIEYAANQLNIDFGPAGQVTKVAGDGDARLVSTTSTAATTVTTRRMDLHFDEAPSGSVLKRADANGHTVVESKPLPRGNAPLPDTRMLRSETVQLSMRPGGEEIERVETHSPGEIEFIPNRPAGSRRTMKAERIYATYGKENRVESLRAVTVATRTEHPPEKGKPVPPALTWSRDLNASFDPATGDMKKLEQWTDFRYEEGDRRARAEHAAFDVPTETITLAGKARVWDSTGSTDGDRIVMNQRTSAFEATGNVTSTRVSEKKPAANAKGANASPMLSGDDPVQARAARMMSVDRNQRITYEGNAVLWQGPNRLTADRIDIDRAAERLEARGSVNTRFIDRGEETRKKKPDTSVFTIVTAPELTWFEKERLAHYRGGVTLTRPDLTVKSRELRAWMNDSTLEKAFADGQVHIVQAAPDRTRTGTGEHAEYYLSEERMVLSGGQPQFVDTVKGTTRGRKLTWFARNDRLLVEGAEAQPAVTTFRKKQ